MPITPSSRSLAGNLRALVTIAFAVAPSFTLAQSPASEPPAVYSVGAAYDAARSRLVVFGGYMNGQYNGDTWEWDGATWTRVAVQGPSARNSPALVYDEARKQIVLFGGDTRVTGALGDTWTYDGTQWRQVATSGPPPRTTHQLVYDSRRSRVVLFGGSAGSTMFGDTWEWDGQQWALKASDGPEARTLYGLAYDAARGRTVLFGGTGVLAPNAPSYGDTWDWDGARWKKVATTGPSARDHVSMGYDATRRLAVMHGGGLGDVDPGETWTFNGQSWTRATATGPRRRYAKLVYDTKAKAPLLYGGFDREPSNELWKFNGNEWTRVAP